MTEVGFEPTPPKRLVPKTSALDHSAIQPLRYTKQRDAPAGARTLGHRLIRPERCQLRHKSTRIQKDASGGFRTHDLGIMRPTRCQLRHESQLQ